MKLEFLTLQHKRILDESEWTKVEGFVCLLVCLFVARFLCVALCSDILFVI